jgi:hypothetical protein
MTSEKEDLVFATCGDGTRYEIVPRDIGKELDAVSGCRTAGMIKSPGPLSRAKVFNGSALPANGSPREKELIRCLI